MGGDVVWDLHQTYGFPRDLTEIIAREDGFSVDHARFDELLGQEQTPGASGPLSRTQGIADLSMKLAGTLPATRFLGYDGAGAGVGAGMGVTATAKAKVLAIIRDGAPVEKAQKGESIEFVVDQTPFYGESGGQVGDTGVAKRQGLEIEVTDTQKPVATLWLHHGTVREGTLSVGDSVTLSVNQERRNRIRANHSATHLLHKALKTVLGDTVNQKGSVVYPDSLRFDFSHFSPVSTDEQERAEDLVNQWIRENEEVSTRLMALAEAKAAGAVALFGEKYGEQVRVVTVHHESTELCGGTHVRRSGDIGLFKITQESSVASGVRRIVALTGAAAVAHMRELLSNSGSPALVVS